MMRWLKLVLPLVTRVLEVGFRETHLERVGPSVDQASLLSSRAEDHLRSSLFSEDHLSVATTNKATGLRGFGVGVELKGLKRQEEERKRNDERSDLLPRM